MYWYDSYGNRENKKEDCDSDEDCEDGKCEEDFRDKDEKSVMRVMSGGMIRVTTGTKNMMNAMKKEMKYKK